MRRFGAREIRPPLSKWNVVKGVALFKHRHTHRTHHTGPCTHSHTHTHTEHTTQAHTHTYTHTHTEHHTHTHTQNTPHRHTHTLTHTDRTYSRFGNHFPEKPHRGEYGPRPRIQKPKNKV